MALLLGAALVMAFVAFNKVAVADACGGRCDEILTSEWAMWLGVVPLLWIGAVFYAGLVIFVWRDPGSTASRGLAGAVLGAAVFLTCIQAFVFHSLCVVCSTAHLLASLSAIALLWRTDWRTPLIAAPAAAAVLAAGAPWKTASPTVQVLPSSGSLFQIEKGGQLSVLDGALSLDVSSLPRWGSSDAKNQAFVVMNFACSRCARLHQSLEQVIKEGGAKDLVVYFVPVATSVQHAEAQAFLLAAWKSHPDAYIELSHRLIRGELELDAQKLGDVSGLRFTADELATARTAMVKHGQLVNLAAERKNVHGFPQLWFADAIETKVWRSVDALRLALNQHLEIGLPVGLPKLPEFPSTRVMADAKVAPSAAKQMGSLAVTPRRIVLPAGPLPGAEDYTIQVRSIGGQGLPSTKVTLPEALKQAGITLSSVADAANHVVELTLHFPVGFDTERHLGSEVRLEGDTRSFTLPVELKGARTSAAAPGPWGALTTSTRP
ncbi:MAG: hypothetical protein JNM99_07695 [Verrucomicrobiaceae bacterium]|nr:hypothetical protein [Verrucomicrobiaceae bacterium]